MNYFCRNFITLDYQQILLAVHTLPEAEQQQLIKELLTDSLKHDYLKDRRDKLVSKLLPCPHCQSINHYRYGIDKGSLRFKCKDCKRTFTEYTGTWLSGIHKKELVNTYIEHLHKKKSLNSITNSLQINKKTAIDWRHKILSSFDEKSQVPLRKINL